MMTITGTYRFDPKTGLFSQEDFFDCAQTMAASDAVNMDAAVIDISHFHLINTLFGREYGDRLLQKTGQHIASFLQHTPGIACRVEADRFYLYLRHRGENRYRALLERLEKDLSDKMEVHLRLGLYRITEAGEDLRAAFDRARQACNYKKNTGITVYSEELNQRELVEKYLIRDIDEALEKRQFEVYYQPKFSYGNIGIVGAEALVRWNHPVLGMIHPGIFVPVFEEKGVLHKLDRYVWKEAASQIRVWKDIYNVWIPVSVNMSQTDLENNKIVDELLMIVRANGLRTNLLDIEIKESAYLENTERAIRTAERLRRHGFRIVVDDFSGKEASLDMLSSFPVDVLKLDMQMISSAESRQMITLIAEIAECLHFEIAAEGVEREEHVNFLRQIGCQLMQGYYYSRPLNTEQFYALIEETMYSHRTA